MSQLVQLFSFDVVASAAFKTKAPDDSREVPSWIEAFKSFYEELPLIFTAEVARLFFDEPDDFPLVPVWKAIGDEIVFIARPVQARELCLLTQAFAAAMAKANDRFNQAWGFQIHGVTWSFEQGDRNIAIRFRELENNQEAVMDLIGPDVDLGFRLVTHAPPGGVLTTADHADRLSGQAVQLDCIGHAPLKGIRRSPYPLLQVITAAHQEPLSHGEHAG